MSGDAAKRARARNIEDRRLCLGYAAWRNYERSDAKPISNTIRKAFKAMTFSAEREGRATAPENPGFDILTTSQKVRDQFRHMAKKMT